MAFTVTANDHDAVRTITLTRPDRRNAVPIEGWQRLTEAFEAFEASAQRALVVRGAGEDFCAGADLSDVFGDPAAAAFSVADAAEVMEGPGSAALALHRLSKPTVAAVDGIAVGAGMNLALGCDVVIATSRARFAEIFVRRGLTVDFGGSWLLPRIAGLAVARELALTGREVDAGEALRLGLVGRVVDPDAFEQVVAETAAALAAGAPLAQRFIKVALDRASTLTFEQALALEDQAQAVLLASQDFREGAAAFLEKRPPDFSGR